MALTPRPPSGRERRCEPADWDAHREVRELSPPPCGWRAASHPRADQVCLPQLQDGARTQGSALTSHHPSLQGRSKPGGWRSEGTPRECHRVPTLPRPYLAERWRTLASSSAATIPHLRATTDGPQAILHPSDTVGLRLTCTSESHLGHRRLSTSAWLPPSPRRRLASTEAHHPRSWCHE